MRIKHEGLRKSYEITQHDIELMKKSKFSYMALRFFTRCCKQCKLESLDCAYDMECYCHREQVELIARKLLKSNLIKITKLQKDELERLA